MKIATWVVAWKMRDAYVAQLIIRNAFQYACLGKVHSRKLLPASDDLRFTVVELSAMRSMLERKYCSHWTDQGSQLAVQPAPFPVMTGSSAGSNGGIVWIRCWSSRTTAEPTQRRRLHKNCETVEQSEFHFRSLYAWGVHTPTACASVSCYSPLRYRFHIVVATFFLCMACYFLSRKSDPDTDRTAHFTHCVSKPDIRRDGL